MQAQNKAAAGQQNELGNACAQQGRFDEAAKHYKQALRLDPLCVEAHNNLGNILKEKGDLKGAAAAFERAASLRPGFAIAHNNLGIVLRALGETAKAEARHRRALEIDPRFAQAWFNLGIALQDRAELDGAEAAYRQAVGLVPAYAEAWLNLGNVLREKAEITAAIECYQKACQANPGYIDAFYDLGTLLLMENRAEEALPCLRRATELGPKAYKAWLNYGNVLMRMGDRNAAVVAYDRSLGCDADGYEAHINRAIANLGLGRFEEGWDEFEWRWRSPDMLGDDKGQAPLWDGGALEGKSILLTCEQGLGDSLQFVRYAPMVAALGSRVTLVCPRPLKRLFAGVVGVEQVLADDEPLPACDCRAPLMSLPRLFKTRLETIPHEVPYLRANAGDAARWKEKLAGYTGMRVGLVWAGQSRIHHAQAFATDKRRSLSLEQLLPLMQAGQGATFFSLQKGGPAEQVKNLPQGFEVVDLMDEVGDFGDTAALVANLDLVIGVDTSVIHLAGGMGKPVWVLSRFDGCWRWLEKREDNPWYPSLRLFTQPKQGDWASVIGQAAELLKTHCA